LRDIKAARQHLAEPVQVRIRSGAQVLRDLDAAAAAVDEEGSRP
jgi:hypothetical protein